MASHLLLFCSIFLQRCLSSNVITGPGVMDFGGIKNQRDIQCNYEIESDKEFKEICEVICLPLHCRNEMLYAAPHEYDNDRGGVTSKRVETMSIKCEENLSCIAKLRLNGEQQIGYEETKEGAGDQILSMFKQGGLPRTHKFIKTENGKLICGPTGQTCVAGQYAFINFHNAHFIGNARDSNLIFKHTNAHIDISEYSNQFIMNSIFTEDVHQFVVDVGENTKHSMAGNVFNLGGLDLNDGTAEFKCHGEMACAGLLIIAQSCGGPIVFDCQGEGSCQFISLNIVQTEECKKADKNKQKRSIQITPNKKNKDIPDFFIWCVKLDEKSKNPFECTHNSAEQIKENMAKEKPGVNIRIFYEKAKYKEAYKEKLAQLMKDYKDLKKGELKGRMHDNQAWVFETKYSKYFGGLMIEGAAKNAMIGGAVFGGLQTIIGTQYLGMSLMHALIPQATPLVIGGLLFVSFSGWHQRLDEIRMGEFRIPKNSADLMKRTTAKDSEYGDWYGDEVEFDEDGDIVLYDVFYAQKEEEENADVAEDGTNVYGYYPHQVMMKTEEDTNEVSTALYAIGALFVTIGFSICIWICVMVLSVAICAMYSRNAKGDDVNRDVEYHRVEIDY